LVRRRPASLRLWSTSRDSKVRSTFCSRLRASRRSISPRFPFWRWPTSFSPSSRRARALRLELAADYLVMAAWLAYLKSRLLLPEQPTPEGLSAEDMANALAQRLRRLEAIRQVAEQLLNRPQLGREVFQRGQPEPIAEIKRPQWTATLYDLLSAYASRRQNEARSHVSMPKRSVWSLAEAREAIERLVGRSFDWSRSTNICSNILSSRRSGLRCSPQVLRRRWNWSVKAGSNCISIRRSRRCSCAPGQRSRQNCRKAAGRMR